MGDKAKRVQPAHDILRNYGIGVNDAVNGVFLPNKIIQAVYQVYYLMKTIKCIFFQVNRIITNANSTGGKQGVIDALDRISYSYVLSTTNTSANWRTVLNKITYWKYKH